MGNLCAAKEDSNALNVEPIVPEPGKEEAPVKVEVEEPAPKVEEPAPKVEEPPAPKVEEPAPVQETPPNLFTFEKDGKPIDITLTQSPLGMTYSTNAYPIVIVKIKDESSHAKAAGVN